LALKSNGASYAWGAGQLTPRLVGSGYTAIAAGIDHALALKANGDLYAWGSNAYGQLGDGTRIDRASPTLIDGGYEAIAAGVVHSLAVKRDGSVWAWGRNDLNEVGDGTFALRTRPVAVLHEEGTGSLATNDWFLALKVGTAAAIPSDKVPALLAVASGSVTAPSPNVSADVRFRAQDAGKPIYVFGYVPAKLVKHDAL